MRIAFISLFKEGGGGGEGRVAHEMAWHFAAEHDTVLICPGDDTRLHRGKNGLRILSLKSAGEGDFRIAATTTKQVSRVFDFFDSFEPEVVHAHEPLSLGLIGQVWAKMHHVPFVHTAHVLPSKMFQFGATEAIAVLQNPVGEMIAKQSLSNFLTNFYDNCDAIIALNRFAAQDIRESTDCDSIFSIPNGRDLSTYSRCNHARVSDEKKVLTFIGFISERKNQRYLAEVLLHLGPEYKLQLVGRSLARKYTQQLREFAQQHRLDVEFIGAVEHHDIPAYLEKAHILTSASRMEVQSLVVIEALASGTPVVGLSNETIDELVNQEVGCRLSRDAEPEAFARCVKTICSLPQEEYDRLCENARARVMGHDWARVITQTIAIYEELQRREPPSAENSMLRMEKALSLIPRGEVKVFLDRRIAQLRRTLRRTSHPTESRFASRIREARRVPNSTWILFALTIPLSWVIYQIAKHVPILSRPEDEREDGPDRDRRPKWLRWFSDVGGVDADV
jgi:1,2-diacylglycerol 3-alpha-glucosyltransferase